MCILIEQDTLRLLRECDAGVKMGISSLDDVIPLVQSESLSQLLSRCKEQHEKLETEMEEALHRFSDEGKNPNPIAKGMSTMKTNLKMAMDKSDQTIADLMTDGCNMGVKSLSRYLNQYAAADEDSKAIAGRLIRLEADLSENLRPYL